MQHKKVSEFNNVSNRETEAEGEAEEKVAEAGEEAAGPEVAVS